MYMSISVAVKFKFVTGEMGWDILNNLQPLGDFALSGSSKFTY